ncbi:MAG: hypothetical protein ABIZ04_15250 [Opitutus sp.]
MASPLHVGNVAARRFGQRQDERAAMTQMSDNLGTATLLGH